MPVSLNNSLIADVNRLPGPPSRTSRGNFIESVCVARFFTMNGGVLTAAGFGEAQSVPIVIFASDHLGPIAVDSAYGGLRLVDTAAHTLDIWAPNGLQEVFNAVGTVVDVNFQLLLTGPNPTNCLPGQTVEGDTVANGVTVRGFPYLLTIADRNLTLTAGGNPLAAPRLFFGAQDSAIHGTPSGVNVGYDDVGGADLERMSIILDQQFYTQAMQDNGNLIDEALHFKVVGLYGVAIIG